ncbi:MAG TPA: hypothetical protein VN903_30410 [Polyangia bacterium]|nr:hypothetical protein [Polyangia bacterium]
MAQPAHLVEHLADTVSVRLFVEIGIVGVDIPDDVLDPQLRLAEIGGQKDNLVHRDRRRKHDPQHAPLSVLDALRDLDLAFARQQRKRRQPAEIRTRWIASGGRIVGFDFGLALSFGARLWLQLRRVFVGHEGPTMRVRARYRNHPWRRPR